MDEDSQCLPLDSDSAPLDESSIATEFLVESADVTVSLGSADVFLPLEFAPEVDELDVSDLLDTEMESESDLEGLPAAKRPRRCYEKTDLQVDSQPVASGAYTATLHVDAQPTVASDADTALQVDEAQPPDADAANTDLNESDVESQYFAWDRGCSVQRRLFSDDESDDASSSESEEYIQDDWLDLLNLPPEIGCTPPPAPENRDPVVGAGTSGPSLAEIGIVVNAETGEYRIT